MLLRAARILASSSCLLHASSSSGARLHAFFFLFFIVFVPVMCCSSLRARHLPGWHMCFLLSFSIHHTRRPTRLPPARLDWCARVTSRPSSRNARLTCSVHVPTRPVTVR
ncbi:hypothetical protein B0H12DRAFT_718171 [Mycena haematopus]|nr:hypothetical protein B0H12DRAFT_718171 [Mycena haematopus]